MHKFHLSLLAVACLSAYLAPFAFSDARADSGRRQNVEQRTLGYSAGVDLTELRNDTQKGWRKNSTTTEYSGSSIFSSDSCNGYTTSSCGLACCGKEECESICTSSVTSAHGNQYTCYEEVQTSSCGKSCCGEQDCINVCLHYRMDPCNGYTVTTGEWNSAAAGLRCCGYDNCHAVECGFNTTTTGDSGGSAGLACCGATNCKLKECNGQIKVDSLVYPDQKDLPCCGAEMCHLVECDNYVSTNTPTGIQQCCGYDDCHYKECEGTFSVKNKAGNDVACCGIDACIAVGLTLESNKSKITGQDTFVTTAYGGVPNVTTQWSVQGPARLLSSDSKFDSNGQAKATWQTVSPFTNVTVTVKAVH
ncbi:MAG: hypothetical protein J5934_00060 [Succinivibrio sp.]|nr:hypothetical protein [Succinivibrio sp.]